jgi:hypothetical protein
MLWYNSNEYKKSVNISGNLGDSFGCGVKKYRVLS